MAKRNNSDKSSQMIDDLLYAIDHQLLDDPVGFAMHKVIQAGVGDSFVISELHSRIQKHRTAQLFAGPFRQYKLSHGVLVLGADNQKRAVRVPIQTLCAHSLTLGGSGCGKTTKSRWMIVQVAPHVSGLWLFDFRKREFACLVPWLQQLGLEVIVVPARSLRINPLQVPDGVDPYNWCSRVADMLVQVFRLPPRATKLLQLTILDLFDQFGVLAGGKKYPTLFDLRETIIKDKTANPQARQAVIDNIDPVLVSLRSVLCYRRGWTSRDLAKHRIIFELDGVGEIEKNLILNSLILPEFTRRVASGVSNQKMSLWIVCDEAARLVSSSSNAGGINDLIGLVRGSSIGLDLSIQSADIAPAILSNTASKFIGRCGSNADYETMSSAMGLTIDQRRSLNHTLVPGMFVGQIGEGQWRHPFIFRVPNIDFSKPPGQACQTTRTVQHLLPSLNNRPSAAGNKTSALGSGLETLLALPTEEAIEFKDWKPREWSSDSSPCSTTVKVNPTLSDAEMRYLRVVIDNPARPSSAYAKLARVGTHQAVALRKRLVERGYIREHQANTGNRGRSSIVLEPLPPAFEALGLQGGKH